MARQLAQEGGGAHAEGDGLSVQETGVAGFGFESVAEGVAEIEDAAEVAFALVGGDHFALHADGIGDDAVDGLRLASQHLAAAIGEKAEQIRFANDAGFDDFVEAGAVFAFGKRVQKRGIDQHRERLVETADEVLAGDEVDAGLAAERGVDLREQRGGNLDAPECRA